MNKYLCMQNLMTTNQIQQLIHFFIDLDEIQKSTQHKKIARDGIKKFNKRDYIEITVVNKAPEAKGTMYIIEIPIKFAAML